MNPQTYAVAEFETEDAARKSGFSVSLTREQAEELAGMNRKQRRAWLRSERKRARKAVAP